MNYRSFSDLNDCILKNLYKFPHDIDLIAGIPRSGMLPANLLALYLNKPYTSVEQLKSGIIYANGTRLIDKTAIKKILIVDDSIHSGASMNKAREQLKDINAEKIFAAIYASPHIINNINIYGEILPPPRCFQWNIFNHGQIENSMFDIDGVLCNDPKIDDDGELYINEITNAKPLYIPKYTIDTIITCRLEKYRDITEKWLKDNSVKYRKLIMLSFKTKAERVAWGKHGMWKGEKFRDSNTNIFYESSLLQAQQIKSVTNKEVFCVETMKFI